MSGIAQLLDIGISLALAGIERTTIVNDVRKLEESGATPDQITDALQKMRQDSEKDAQSAIDKQRS
jgi:hypothetical protein